MVCNLSKGTVKLLVLMNINRYLAGINYFLILCFRRKAFLFIFNFFLLLDLGINFFVLLNIYQPEEKKIFQHYYVLKVQFCCCKYSCIEKCTQKKTL